MAIVLSQDIGTGDWIGDNTECFADQHMRESSRVRGKMLLETLLSAGRIRLIQHDTLKHGIGKMYAES